MNRICSIQRDDGGWIVEARTPEGMRVVIYTFGSRKAALMEARFAEAEPA